MKRLKYFVGAFAIAAIVGVNVWNATNVEVGYSALNIEDVESVAEGESPWAIIGVFATLASLGYVVYDHCKGPDTGHLVISSFNIQSWDDEGKCHGCATYDCVSEGDACLVGGGPYTAVF